MEYLLYGANGYTSQLIIKESLKQGLKPTLAGRNQQKIEAVAKKYDLPFLVFSLNKPAVIKSKLQNFSLCVNAAGPFSKTAIPMAKACIASHTHYLDITGEIEVFEQLKTLDAKAKQKNVMVMPGVGFDVVPTDCVANYLKEKMPDAQELELAFASVGGALSHGTASTAVEQLGQGSLVRRNGKLEKVPLAHKSKEIQFGDHLFSMATIPWGDVSTAYTSTSIPNIEVYTSIPKNMIRLMKLQGIFNPLLRTSLVKNLAQKWVDKNVYGPNEKQNKKGKSYVHGIVRNGEESKAALLICSEGYLVTALCTVNISQKVLREDFKSGYQTPAAAYGWKLILEIPGSKITDQ